MPLGTWRIVHETCRVDRRSKRGLVALHGKWRERNYALVRKEAHAQQAGDLRQQQVPCRWGPLRGFPPQLRLGIVADATTKMSRASPKGSHVSACGKSLRAPNCLRRVSTTYHSTPSRTAV